MPKSKEATTKTTQATETQKFKGKFTETVGKRKTAMARVRWYRGGGGEIIVNQQKIDRYFTPSLVALAMAPLKLVGLQKDFNLSIRVAGGGKKGQASAIKHGIARLLIKHNEDLRPVLKAKNFLTRDARKKERKKPGLKKARRAPQWSKR